MACANPSFRIEDKFLRIDIDLERAFSSALVCDCSELFREIVLVLLREKMYSVSSASRNLIL